MLKPLDNSILISGMIKSTKIDFFDHASFAQDMMIKKGPGERIMTESVKKGIDGSTLKLIAVFSMLVDHTAAVLVWNPLNPQAVTIVPDMVAGWNASWLIYLFMRYPIGRLAFPIYCFLLVEGFVHTRSIKKYALRMLLFALISEIPFDLAFYGKTWGISGQNVFFTLFLGIALMAGLQLAEKKCIHLWQVKVCQILWTVVICFAANLIACDYGAKGILPVLVLYLLRQDKKTQAVAGSVVFSWEITAPLAFIPIYRYNGKRGMNLKYFFYAFYPVHLLILYGILHLL